MSSADRTYDNATTFEEMMAWHREDRPSCPSTVVVMARFGYGCEMCGWSVEEASPRPRDHPQPCDHWSPHPAPTCVPLCAASRVYTRPQWWQHEALCPVRIEYLERRSAALAEAAEHDSAIAQRYFLHRREDPHR